MRVNPDKEWRSFVPRVTLKPPTSNPPDLKIKMMMSTPTYNHLDQNVSVIMMVEKDDENGLKIVQLSRDPAAA